MVTGARRGELCGLRWSKVDLDQGTIVVDTSVAQNSRKKWLKDTKTHQHRRLTLDPETSPSRIATLQPGGQATSTSAPSILRLLGSSSKYRSQVFRPTEPAEQLLELHAQP
jgi:integrase